MDFRSTGLLINEMNSREAMGLPDSFVDTELDCLRQEYDVLKSLTQDELLLIIEGPMSPPAVRYAAGLILALKGDPRINSLCPQMITVEGATVKLGLPYDKVERVVEKYQQYGVIRDWIEKECPEHEVELTTFGIGKYCVTNQEYLEYLKDTGNKLLPTSWAFGVYPMHLSNHPVHTISAEQADAYCVWLSEKTGRAFRLPTEAEWEYAAGGPDGLEYPWGDQYLTGKANTVEEGLLRTTPIGMYASGASPFGVMDMSGNVEEYTSSEYVPYPNGVMIEDDLLISEGQYRVARGGSFTRFKDLARTRRRHGWYKKDIYVMGFRLAESL
ncbi:SUMF1/EgtB/PvdO family nonheme iron enzyme [Vibrio sp. SCSIO 43136]|uniref:formylglycine-generating enzyme family protein n=1 Tax=Vibrio sp. SCSIO 43136 TaxID=2819101 RepID=UPI00207515E5|nr:SUMF1/EgtB/PvdO family nonheme iron enzyme [Vibrio sp. SCSIO 43136]USD67357.1 SUMF1/EgtB/PvdO family nonheme iron enzyme [Vibrio sp. SCSIO 43136]